MLFQWSEQGSQCESRLVVCGPNAGTQSNWLITQHINRTVEGYLLPQVTVQIDLVQSHCGLISGEACINDLDLLVYETSVIDQSAAQRISNYVAMSPLRALISGQRNQTSVNIRFSTNKSGFYLAIRDAGSCVVIFRIVVLYYICPMKTENLVYCPEIIAPPIGSSQQLIVNASCIENASLSVENQFSLKCLEGGHWIGTYRCMCDNGLIPTNDGTICQRKFVKWSKAV